MNKQLPKPLLADGIEFKLGMRLYYHNNPFNAILYRDTNPSEHALSFLDGAWQIHSKEEAFCYIDIQRYYSSYDAIIDIEINNKQQIITRLTKEITELQALKDNPKFDRKE